MLKILNINSLCTGCGACTSSCSSNALIMCEDKEGFYYPKINQQLCIDCKMCESVCPVINKFEQNKNIPEQYSGKSTSQEIFNASSSGGVFSVLANMVIEQGGVVYGARYNFKTERLEHTSTDQFELSEFRKSKYIESYLGDTYQSVKKNLLLGRKVLFCSTPCQTAGLKRYLNKIADKNNLLLVDFVCHGVPSNKHFTEYKHYIEKKNKFKVVQIDFRPKNRGWRTPNIILGLSNGKQLDINSNMSLYYYAFQQNEGLRKSCYTCNWLLFHLSDITLGDFWGIRNYNPAQDDDRGISIIMANNDKGKSEIEKIKNSMIMEPIPKDAIRYAFTKREDGIIYSMYRRTIFSKRIKQFGYLGYLKRLYLPFMAYIAVRMKLSKFIKSILKIK